jgi:hypothetical protein
MMPKNVAKRPLKQQAAYLGVGKKGLLRLGKHMIVEWLKSYFENQTDDTPACLWEQLKSHAESREWKMFGNVIRKKWRAQGRDKDAVRCLDNSLHCVNIWDRLNA